MKNISNELLEKYNVEKYVEGNPDYSEKSFWMVLLQNTDHVFAKLFEGFIDTMTGDGVNVGNMVKFFKEVKTEYADVMEARKTAREEINRIEGETTNG